MMCLGFSAGAQSLNLNIEVPAETKNDALKVYARSLSSSQQNAVALTRDDSRQFKASLPICPDGIYYIYAQDSMTQVSIPVYIPSTNTDAKFALSINGYKPSTSINDNANKALAAYCGSVIDKTIKLSHLDSLSDTQIKNIINGFYGETDSILNAYSPIPESVADFIKIFGYASASDAINITNWLSARSGRTITIIPDSILPDAKTILDTPMAAYFPSTGNAIMASLPGKTMEERLTALYDNYTTPELKNKVAEMILGTFISNFDYTDFDNGEARLMAVTEKYSLPDKFLTSFRARQATITGKDFPDAKLVDRDGNDVNFSRFKGKYVFVDLWASWCGPCCREVPSLQALEKEMKDSNVEFVSISIDSEKEPWLQKMEQLNMHGNQFWNSDAELPNKLNVRSIPHFLIYDPDGKLYQYNAPRPSSENIREVLNSLK